jgi:hypothetical protein
MKCIHQHIGSTFESFLMEEGYTSTLQGRAARARAGRLPQRCTT